MTEEFEAQIQKLAEKYKKKPEESVNEAISDDPGFKAVLKEFLTVSQKAAAIYNKAQNREVIKVYELPPDFLEIFLGIPGRKGGLSIVSDQKLAVFFDEYPDLITVIGKYRSDNSSIQSNTNKTLQLMKIAFSTTQGGYSYKDNTGKPLDPGDIITVILSWLVQA